MVTAGARNRLVELFTMTVTSPKGEVTETPATAGSRWARRQGVPPTERFIGEQRFGAADFVFVFGSDAVTRAIDATYEIVDDSVTYQVNGAHDPTGMEREVWVYAVRKDA